MDDFEEFVAGRSLALTRFAYVLSGDRHLAEDLVQEVLARLHRRWPRVAAGGQPDAYVRRAIVRELLSWRRRRASGERPMAAVPECADAYDTAGCPTPRPR
jgi:DNA-directed RNA polymerase specialized sigma24 family protein